MHPRLPPGDFCLPTRLFLVYLKTKGLDPKTHPVVAELVRFIFFRIKRYHLYIVFGLRTEYDNTSIKSRTQKILQNVRIVLCTRSQSHRICHHHTGQFAVDRAAATRFIKHAIAQAKDAPPAPTSDSSPTTARVPSNTDGPADPAPALVPVKVTEKMLEREQYQRTLHEEEREEESGDLKVIDGEEDDDDEERTSDNSPTQAPGVAAKGKSKVPSEMNVAKRRRRPIDPFAGLCTFVQSLSNLTVPFPPACFPRLWRRSKSSPFCSGR